MSNESHHSGKEFSDFESKETILARSPLLRTYISSDADPLPWMDEIKALSEPYYDEFRKKLRGRWEVILYPLINQGKDTRIFTPEIRYDDSLNEQAVNITLANVFLGFELRDKRHTFTFIDKISERYATLPFVDPVHKGGTLPVNAHLKQCMDSGVDIYDLFERTNTPTSIQVRFLSQSYDMGAWNGVLDNIDMEWMR